jgi:two-component system response regulator PilR (NtrC family)
MILGRIAAHASATKPRIDRNALGALFRYSFPGNIRELENILERAVALCEAETITREDLLIPADTAARAPTTGRLESDLPLDEHLEQVELELITQALEETRWNKTAAAKRLGISFRALRYKLDRLGMD